MFEQQQAALRDIADFQANLRGVIERVHRELCERIDSSMRSNSFVRPSFPAASRLSAKAAATGAKGELVESSMEGNPSQSASRSSSGLMSAIVEGPLFDIGMRAADVGEDPPEGSLRGPHPPGLCKGLVIVLNSVMAFVELQWKGTDTAHRLGLIQGDPWWPSAEKVFQALEMGYALEVLMHCCVSFRQYLCKWHNLIDALIVVASCVDAFFLTPMHKELGHFNLARLEVHGQTPESPGALGSGFPS
mmetsp:Transcript_81479/g.189236  ORF Transcript_81479/g.189236 Transcript_81479/m.189236 type:complete len:247 (+) Transcript_81479:257-997(+)